MASKSRKKQTIRSSAAAVFNIAIKIFIAFLQPQPCKTGPYMVTNWNCVQHHVISITPSPDPTKYKLAPVINKGCIAHPPLFHATVYYIHVHHDHEKGCRVDHVYMYLSLIIVTRSQMYLLAVPYENSTACTCTCKSVHLYIYNVMYMYTYMCVHVYYTFVHPHVQCTLCST